MKCLIILGLLSLSFANSLERPETKGVFNHSLIYPQKITHSSYQDNDTSSKLPARLNRSTTTKAQKSVFLTSTLSPKKLLTTEPAFTYGDSPRINVQQVDYDDEYVQPKNKEDFFDWKLSREIFKQSKKENVIVSPLSVKILLTILAEAAGQDVSSDMRKELLSVLPLRKTLNDTREYFKKVLSSLNTTSKHYTINIGSKGYVRQGVFLSQKFTAELEHNYKIKMEPLNFTDPDASANKINEWVNGITNGKISNLVDAESVASSVMLLINAVYFRGLWSSPFEETISKAFFVEPHEKVEKEFVKQTGDFLYFYSTELKARFLRMPYEGKRFSMFLILPFENDGLHDVIEQLDAEMIRKTVERMEEIAVQVILPKFRFDTSMNLNTVIKNLGIKEIFSETATFPLLAPGLTGARIRVSNIIQKSGIVVDEKGTEAHAATEVELIDKFGGDPRDFIADHPFLFYIEDDTTGAKVFSGIVNNPEY